VRRKATTAVLAVVLLIGSAVVAGATVAATSAYFTDTETSSASISVATDFGAPGDAVAWNDADGDGVYDEGESTYTESDLTKKGKGGQNELNFAGQNISSTENITLEISGNGGINLADSKIEVDGDILITTSGAKGDVDLTDAQLIATGSIKIDVNNNADITLTGSTCDPEADIPKGNKIGQNSCSPS